MTESPSWLGTRRVRLESCESTNDEAHRLAVHGAEHGTVVIARTQSAGRGRQGRAWYSPPGQCVYLSCIVRPSLPPANVPLITLAAGVAVCDAVNFYGAGASLQWPNDVFVGHKKIAGALTEMHSKGHQVDHVVLGIGVNVTVTVFPPELSDIATSLVLCANTEAGVVDVAERLLHELEPRLDALLSRDTESIRSQWLERAGLPRQVMTERGPGTAVDLTDSGALVVVDPAGARYEIVSGNVSCQWEQR